LRAHPQDEAALARALGPEVARGTLVPTAFVLPSGTPTHTLKCRFEVQDEGSQWVVAQCGPVGGLRVLDACAGAGGKALALAAAGAVVTAADVRERALAELSQRARDHGVRIRTWLGELNGVGTYDLVLVDAPCTGSGTWRRHPELRWRLRDLAALTALQASILDAAWACVRPGGRLVYATCSVLRDENEHQATAFAERTGAALTSQARVSPYEHGTDAFFVASFARSAQV
jgi:16S rRNA (cytosine967-C5)-methyltransferase